jgi:hypothetical protein
MFLTLTSGAMLTARALWSANSTPQVPPMLDHILLGCSDLDYARALVEQHTGVQPAVGGVHPGRGTRNALLSLGKMHYLEIIAPDPAQSGLAAAPPSMLYKLRHMDQPQIVTWAAHTSDMEAAAAKLRQAGIAFEGPTPGSRNRPDGHVLHWQTLNLNDDRDGMLPFFIQWGAGSVHPSIDAPAGCTLRSFEANGPNPTELANLFQQLGIEVQVGKAASPGLHAEIKGLHGRLELHS